MYSRCGATCQMLTEEVDVYKKGLFQVQSLSLNRAVLKHAALVMFVPCEIQSVGP